ncbi:F0F1 ATP synthase subunit delta [Ornithinimicrobium panacihumi]|uniref:F0F1 ATP synthase subunit delta n=1 Tax=Ornithinimicrobium panacihumi TaxID=2008449 RepID=UPI003F897579
MDSSFRRSYQPARQALDEVLAHEGGSIDPSRVADEAWAVAKLVQDNAVLRRSLGDSSREGGDKAALVERLLGGKVGAGALHLTKAVAAQRWSDPGDVVTALDRLGVEAVLANAERHGRLGQVEDELFRFTRIVEASPELQAALTDRRADADAKQALVDRLLSIKAAPETVRLAKVAVSGSRDRRFDRIVDDYLEQAAERQDQVTATVTSAVPLSPEQHDKLVAALSRQYGRQVHTNVVIDEDVVGGIKVEIGDEVIDGTVSQRLAEARRRMTS